MAVVTVGERCRMDCIMLSARAGTEDCDVKVELRAGSIPWV